MTSINKTLLAFGSILIAGALHAQQPNIIFFFTDDLGYGDVGCFWQDGKSGTQKFDTPNIDSMAAAGAKLTDHYVSASVCAPSRASLLQGLHQGHCDVRDSQFDKALPDTHGLAEVLHRAGYHTIHVGKNGLAGAENSTNLAGTGSQNLAAHPLDRGFDEFFGYLFHADGHEHYPRNGTSDKVAHIYNGYQQITNASVDLYTTDAWTAYAKKAITEEVNDGDSQPFFLYMAYDTPHFKMQRPAVAYPAGGGTTGGIQWTTATDGSGKVRYASTATGTGVIDAYTHPDINPSWPVSNQQHVGMIRRMDNSIGDIMKLLVDLGIDDNTLCVFSSDNGPHNEGNDPRYFQSFANLEGIKRDMWEGGIRVPTIVRWPNHIAGATGNENNIHEIHYPSAIWDWMPTFAEAAGVPAPAWCDGVSLLPTLTGTGTQRDKGYLYFEFQNGGSTPNWTQFPNHKGDTKGQMQCLRIGDHMGVRTGITSANDNFRIYDVTTDPGQGNNLAGSLPALQQKMKDLALQARMPGGGVTRPYDSANVAPVAASVTQGLDYATYQGSWTYVPEFRDLAPVTTGNTSSIDLSVRPRDNDVGILFTGFINITTAGSHTFYLTSDDGADLFIHDAHVIADDYNHNGSERSGTIRLQTGRHPIRLYYRHNSTATHALGLQWQGPSFSKQAVPDSALFRAGTPAPEPQANSDNVETSTTIPITINVLANDFDDGAPSPLSISTFTQPSNGSVSQLGNTLVYTPNGTYTGIDSFSYTVTDGQYFATADVNVTVSIPTFTPVARWSMDECSGTTTVEKVAEVTSDTLGSGVVWSLDTPGPASRSSLAFPGTAAGNFGTNLGAQDLGIAGNGAKTIAGWIKTSANFYGMFFSWSPLAGGGAGQNLRLGLDTGGRLRFEVSSGYARYDAKALNDGQWHMVAVIIEPGDTVSTLQFYIDGSLVNATGSNTTAINTAATGTAPADEIYLGSGYIGSTLYWNGLLDDVQVFSQALSLATLNQIRAAMAVPVPVVTWGGAGSQAAPEFWNLPVDESPGRNDDPTHWGRTDPPDLTGPEDALINGGGIQKNAGLSFSCKSKMTLENGAFFVLNPTSSTFDISTGSGLLINNGNFEANVSEATVSDADASLEVVSGTFKLAAQGSTSGFGLNGGATATVRDGGVIETSTWFDSQNLDKPTGGKFVIDGGTLLASGANNNPLRAGFGLDGGGFNFTKSGGTLQIDNFTGAGTLTSYLQGKAGTGFFKINGTTVTGFGTANESGGFYLALTDGGISGKIEMKTILTGYAAWIDGFPVGGLTEINDNPDSDLAPNGIEFLLGGNPTIPNDVALPATQTDAADLVITFDRHDQAIGFLDVVVQRSTDLVTWPATGEIVIGNDTAGSGPEVTITDNGTTDHVEVRIPRAPDTSKFVRLKVSDSN